MPNWGQVITAMVTPFDSQGRVDDKGVERVVEYLLANGSDGVVVAGTTGESPTLTHEEKIHLFRLVKSIVGNRGSVIAGTGSNDTASSLELSKEASALGVDGLLLVAPYYNKPSQEGLYQHFRIISEAVDVPVMLYNVPPRTSCNIDAKTVLRLAHDVENVVAVKEASSNLVQVSEIAAGAPEGFLIYSGEDGIVLPTLAVGGVGVVSVSAHVVGRDLKEMHRRFFAGDLKGAQELHFKMLPIVRALFQPTTPSPAPVKAAMNLLGLEAGSVRLPLVDANPAETAIVKSALELYGHI